MVPMRARSFLLLLVLPWAVLGWSKEPLREGDIVFHTSRSSQSQAIQRATGSQYSHMGVIVFRQGRPYVLEAVDPVCLTPLSSWVARGERGEYAVRRLREAESVLTPSSVAKFEAVAKSLVGLRYDSVFEWSDSRLYCSELVYKLFERALGVRLCPLRRLDSFNLADPAVKKKLLERYGPKVPLAEPVVAPSDIYNSPLLRPVEP